MIKKIILFSAPSWCAPCRYFAPVFEEVSKIDRYKDIEFVDIDVDFDKEHLADKYFVKNIPTMVFLNENNEVMKKLSGAMNKEDFVIEIYKVKNEGKENN